jgi:phage-related tail fiber protein
MEQKNVEAKVRNTRKSHPKLNHEHVASLTGTAAHTYDLWKKQSYAEHAAIIARATELMKLISDRHLSA